MYDHCPSCGKPTGYVMELKGDGHGLLDILRGEAGDGLRLACTIALCVLVVLAVTATRVVLLG